MFGEGKLWQIHHHRFLENNACLFAFFIAHTIIILYAIEVLHVYTYHSHDHDEAVICI